jgi:hypothetical protein
MTATIAHASHAVTTAFAHAAHVRATHTHATCTHSFHAAARLGVSTALASTGIGHVGHWYEKQTGGKSRHNQARSDTHYEQLLTLATGSGRLRPYEASLSRRVTIVNNLYRHGTDMRATIAARSAKCNCDAIRLHGSCAELIFCR